MRAIIQRVNAASVKVANKEVASINKGLLIFLGILKDDDSSSAKYLAKKIPELRIFNDQDRKMNLESLAKQLLAPRCCRDSKMLLEKKQSSA